MTRWILRLLSRRDIALSVWHARWYSSRAIYSKRLSSAAGDNWDVAARLQRCRRDAHMGAARGIAMRPSKRRPFVG